MKIRSLTTGAILAVLTGPTVGAALLVGIPAQAVVVPPEAPQVSASATCSDVSAATGTATITIVNPPDNGDPRTYSWTVSGPVPSVGAVAVADGASETVSRTGLTGGAYTVSVLDALDPSLNASASFTVEDCLGPPPSTTTTTTSTTTVAPDPTTTVPSGPTPTATDPPPTPTDPAPTPTGPPPTSPPGGTLPATGVSTGPVVAVALGLGGVGLTLWAVTRARRLSS